MHARRFQLFRRRWRRDRRRERKSGVLVALRTAWRRPADADAQADADRQHADRPAAPRRCRARSTGETCRAPAKRTWRKAVKCFMPALLRKAVRRRIRVPAVRRDPAAFGRQIARLDPHKPSGRRATRPPDRTAGRRRPRHAKPGSRCGPAARRSRITSAQQSPGRQIHALGRLVEHQQFADR